MPEVKKPFKVKPEAETPKTFSLRAVHGLMIHPFTQERFETDGVTIVQSVDEWTKRQLDAGKLTHVAE